MSCEECRRHAGPPSSQLPPSVCIMLPWQQSAAVADEWASASRGAHRDECSLRASGNTAAEQRDADSARRKSARTHSFPTDLTVSQRPRDY